MSTLKRVLFVSQPIAERMRVPLATALISITDVGAPQANLAHGWAHLLRLSFDDVDPVDYPVDIEERLRPISDAQALELAAFVAGLEPSCTRLVVHCRYGQSRSSAIAKAICERHQLVFPPGYSLHNEFVYRAVSWALGEQQ